MQCIAVPMICGMISSTPLTLIVIPAIWGLVKGAGSGVCGESGAWTSGSPCSLGAVCNLVELTSWWWAPNPNL
jgi:hypothetical protein